MPEQLWPLILVALLAGLVASSLPFLGTLNPSQPGGRLARLISELEGVRDLSATVTLNWAGEGTPVRFKLKWLTQERAFHVEFLSPEGLAGEEFSYQGGVLYHFVPADPRYGTQAGVVVTRLSALIPGGEELLKIPVSPRELVTALRRGSLKATQVLLDEGIRLQVSGQFPELPQLRQVTLDFSSDGTLPRRAVVEWDGAQPRTLEVLLEEVQVNTGLALRDVREFPAYSWVLPR